MWIGRSNAFTLASGANKDSTWYQNAIEEGQTRTVMLPRKVEMILTG